MSTHTFVARTFALAVLLAGGGALRQITRAAESAAALAANHYWAQFAKTGDPDSAGGVLWPRFDVNEELVMVFPASGVPLTAKHFHKTRLDWIEASLGG